MAYPVNAAYEARVAGTTTVKKAWADATDAALNGLYGATRSVLGLALDATGYVAQTVANRTIQFFGGDGNITVPNGNALNVASVSDKKAFVNVQRIKAGGGTALVAGDFADFSSAWGNTGGASGPYDTLGGTDMAGTVRVTCSGTGIAANPGVVLTFHDGTFTNAPIVVGQWVDAASPTTSLPCVAQPTATTCTFRMLATPTTGHFYTLTWIAIGR